MSGIASVIDWCIANPSLGVPFYLLCHCVMTNILYRIWKSTLSLVDAVQLSAMNRFSVLVQLFFIWSPVALFGVVLLIHILQTR